MKIQGLAEVRGVDQISSAGESNRLTALSSGLAAENKRHLVVTLPRFKWDPAAGPVSGPHKWDPFLDPFLPTAPPSELDECKLKVYSTNLLFHMVEVYNYWIVFNYSLFKFKLKKQIRIVIKQQVINRLVSS